MAATKTDANGNLIYITDPSGNEIEGTGKVIAGFILILVTLLTVVVIIAHWPDKMPAQGSQVSTKYQYKWFAVNYLGENGKGTDEIIFKTKKDSVQAAAKTEHATDTPAINNNDTPVTLPILPNNDTPDKKNPPPAEPVYKKSTRCTIDLNTLILLLVALAGFLGNLIHVASSFTNFIGAGKFKRSWMLWYVVKPFTASALAVGVYIIFRAGFLNSGDATASVNLYGVVAIALLAGLYTDMATQKLKEVFGVIFQSSTVRPNPLELPPVKITSVNPKVLPLNTLTEVVLSGSGFDNRTLKLTINAVEITGVTIQPNSIVFKYTATDKQLALIIYDEKGAELAKYDLTADVVVVPTPPAPPVPPLPPAAPITVTAVTPATIAVNTATEITLTGTNLNTDTLAVKVADAVIADVDITKTLTEIKFTYTATVAGDIAIVITDSAGNEFSQTINAT